MTERLATAAARHPGLTLGAWVVAVVVSLVLIVFFLGDALSGEAEQLNNPESEQAYSLIGERLPPDPSFTTDVVLIRSDSLVTDRRARSPVWPLRQALEATDGVAYVSAEPVARAGRALVLRGRARGRVGGRKRPGGPRAARGRERSSSSSPASGRSSATS